MSETKTVWTSDGMCATHGLTPGEDGPSMTDRTVAALYIDPRGPYPTIEGVDCWDETRDARLYEGPHPIVAHPPCGPWGALRHLTHVTGANIECAPRAVEQVRQWGGVLEHPKGSMLWPELGLPTGAAIDAFGGYSIEVTQVEWGHPARKATWLYLVRVPWSALEDPPFPGRQPTHWVAGSHRAGMSWTTPVPDGIKVCSAQQRRRTPIEFARYLVRLARSTTP